MDNKNLYTEIMTDALTLSELTATKSGNHTPVISITDLEIILKEHLKEQ